MKDSSLLKWTQNNKNNKLTGSGEKKDKKKPKEEKNKNWLHTPENLTSGHIAYLVKVSSSIPAQESAIIPMESVQSLSGTAINLRLPVLTASHYLIRRLRSSIDMYLLSFSFWAQLK